MGLYVVRNITNGRTYAGHSLNSRGRLLGHLRDLRNGTHPVELLQYDFKSLGEAAFTFEQTQPIDIKEPWSVAEWRLINHYPLSYNHSKRDDATNSHYRNLLVRLGHIHPLTFKRCRKWQCV